MARSFVANIISNWKNVHPAAVACPVKMLVNVVVGLFGLGLEPKDMSMLKLVVALGTVMGIVILVLPGNIRYDI